ncbi:hypothetical protein H4R19_003988 [Coemansia spiralis]|nr:hypothetical protein H4R19_003988 [Coemansia spiralis]
MRRVFQYLVDFQPLEWFEDPDFLGTWGMWAEMVLPLLGVCQYWRGLACPLYYQYAAGCYGSKSYGRIRQACGKAHIDSIGSAHLRGMVKHVYLCLYLHHLLEDGLQGVLDRCLGDAAFPSAQQLVIVLEEEGGGVGQQQAIDDALPAGAMPHIISACERLRAAFPGVVAAQVVGTRRTTQSAAITMVAREMLRGRAVLSVGHLSYEDLIAPQLCTGGLTWIKIDHIHLCVHGVALIRRSAPSLQTVILTKARANSVKSIMRDEAGALLVYPRVVELRLQLECWDAGEDFELPDYAPFPALVRISAAPRDPHIGSLAIRGNGSSLVQLRLFLSGRTVTRMHAAGALDGSGALPALRHIELYRPAWPAGSGGNEDEDGPSSLSRASFERFVWWALTTGHGCSRIVLCGWRMELRLGRGGLAQLVSQLGSGIRRLDLPVACTVADALWLVGRLPHLDGLGIALDGCAAAGDSAPVAEYVRTAVVVRQSWLRALAVPIAAVAGVQRQRDIALACALAELVPSVRVLEPRAAHSDAAGHPLNPVAVERDIAAALGSAAEMCRAGLAVEPRSPDPPWL